MPHHVKAVVLLCWVLYGCTGCAGPRPKVLSPSSSLPDKSPATAHFEVRGKASLSDGRRHVQLSLHWKQVGDHTVIYLYGPLGSGAVRISNDPKHPSRVEYQDAKGAIRHYGSAEALLAQETGWALPISGLSWWLRGLPQPTQPKAGAPTIVRHPEGPIIHMEQEGWTIDYGTYPSRSPLEAGSARSAQRDVPHTVQLRRGRLRLKFLLREWK